MKREILIFTLLSCAYSSICWASGVEDKKQDALKIGIKFIQDKNLKAAIAWMKEKNKRGESFERADIFDLVKTSNDQELINEFFLQTRKPEFMKELLSLANVIALDSFNQTILHRLAQQLQKNPNNEVLDCLLQVVRYSGKADVKVDSNRQKASISSPEAASQISKQLEKMTNPTQEQVLGEIRRVTQDYASKKTEESKKKTSHVIDSSIRDNEGRLAWFWLKVLLDTSSRDFQLLVDNGDSTELLDWYWMSKLTQASKTIFDEIEQKMSPTSPLFQEEADAADGELFFNQKNTDEMGAFFKSFRAKWDTNRSTKDALLLIGAKKAGKRYIAKYCARKWDMNFVDREKKDKVLGSLCEKLNEKRKDGSFTARPTMIFVGNVQRDSAFMLDTLNWLRGEKSITTEDKRKIDFPSRDGCLLVVTVYDLAKLEQAEDRAHFNTMVVDNPDSASRKNLLERYLNGYPQIDINERTKKKFLLATENCTLGQLIHLFEQRLRKDVERLSISKIEPQHLKMACQKMFADFNFKDGEERIAFLKQAYSIPSFSDLWGMEPIIERLKLKIKLLIGDKRPGVLLEVSRSILFEGPPGTGKTSLAQALANEINWYFFSATASEFQSSKHGGGTEKIVEFFKKARSEPRSVIFIDELDLLGSRAAEQQHQADTQTLGTLWTQIESILNDQESKCLIVAATNYAAKIDPTLARRFKVVETVDLPTESGCGKILKGYLNKLESGSVDLDELKDTAINDIAHKAFEWKFSCSDLKNLIVNAGELAVQEGGEKAKLKREHINTVFNKMKGDAVERYNGWVEGKPKKKESAQKDQAGPAKK